MLKGFVEGDPEVTVDPVALDVRGGRECHRAQSVSLDAGFFDGNGVRTHLEVAGRYAEAAGALNPGERGLAESQGVAGVTHREGFDVAVDVETLCPVVRRDFDVRGAPARRAFVGLETAGFDDVVGREHAAETDGRVDRAGHRYGLAVRVLDEQGRDTAAEPGRERALGAAHRRDGNKAVVDTCIDDQRRVAIGRVAARKRGERIAHIGVMDFNAMLALRRKPATIETLRGHDDSLVLVRGPLQVVVDGFLGNAADNARRYQYDDGGDHEQYNDALSHGGGPGSAKSGMMLAWRPADSRNYVWNSRASVTTIAASDFPVLTPGLAKSRDYSWLRT